MNSAKCFASCINFFCMLSAAILSFLLCAMYCAVSCHAVFVSNKPPAGVRLLFDTTFMSLATSDTDSNSNAPEQLQSLLDTLSDIKQLLPANSPCGAYVPQQCVSRHSGMLQQWLLTQLMQPMPPAAGAVAAAPPGGLPAPRIVLSAKQVWGVVCCGLVCFCVLDNLLTIYV